MEIFKFVKTTADFLSIEDYYIASLVSYFNGTLMFNNVKWKMDNELRGNVVVKIK